MYKEELSNSVEMSRLSYCRLATTAGATITITAQTCYLIMRTSTLCTLAFAVLSAAVPVFPRVGHRILRRQADSNPFEGKKLFVNPTYAEKLGQTVESFEAAGDTANAEKTRAIQDIGTFVWISDIASLSHIHTAIEDARAAQAETGETQIVGLVLYNLPDRDCSAGE